MGAPKISHDGSVISSHLNAINGDFNHASKDLQSNSFLYRGQITRIYTVKDKNNVTGRVSGVTTVYDVMAVNSSGGTFNIPRCHACQPIFGGGFNNFFEVLPNDPGPTSEDHKIPMTLKRGTWVIVGCIAGKKSAGIILGAFPHPNPVAVKRRPDKSLGSHLEGEFQGLNFQIKNNGSLLITFMSPRTDAGDPTTQNGPTTVEIDGSGNLNIATNNKQSASINRVDRTITVINGDTSYKMEQDGAKITVKCKDLLVDTTNEVRIKAKNQSFLHGENSTTVSSAKKIMLSRSIDGNPTEPFVLGNKFMNFMQRFLKECAVSTHTGNLGYPTSEPNNAAAFDSLSSELPTLLSKLITGEK